MMKNKIEIIMFFICILLTNQSSLAAPVAGSPEGDSGPSGPPPSSCPTSCPSPQVQDPTTCDCSCPATCTAPQVQNTTTCACVCPSVCPVGQVQNSTTCACSCPTTCTAPQVQNTTTCACVCPSVCPVGQVQNSTTCACSCPTTCTAPQVQNTITCACSCPTTCTAPQVQNPTTCACSCPAVTCTVTGQTQNTTSCACGCPSGQSVCTNTNPNKCTTTCVSPRVFNSSCSGCVCPAALPTVCNGNCVNTTCPVGKTWDSATCSCKCNTPCLAGSGKVQNTSTCACTCPTSKPHDLGGVCSADSCALKFRVYSSGGTSNVNRYSQTTASPTCLTGIVNSCRANNGYGITNPSHTAYDNYVGYCIIRDLGNTSSTRGTASNQTNVDNIDTYFRDVQSYFDSNCNPMPTNLPAAQVCNAGSYNFSISPIVLLWDRSFGVEDLKENVRLVSFPLDPTQGNKLVEWKASANAPLLVYDPTGEGKITSGYQLFGNWTFGPKKVASLANTITDGGKLWNNGFDALAKLDINADGEISGAELEPLSLWFDDNRNGVSESGEVRRLSAVGVKKLFYRGYETNDAAHAIVLQVGFERERDGKIERGTMVDWFADAVSSELEYAQKAMVTSAFGKEAKDNHNEIRPEIPTDQSELLAYKNGAKAVKGLWQWTSNSDKIPASGGIFIILDNKDGTIRGLTMIELPMDTSFGATSVASVVRFNGKAKLEKDGSVTFSFALNKKSGSDLKSTAKVDAAGESMTGSSNGTIENKAASTKISYPWTASRWK